MNQIVEIEVERQKRKGKIRDININNIERKKIEKERAQDRLRTKGNKIEKDRQRKIERTINIEKARG